MADHALLGPSSAHRWLTCTPSARLEEEFNDTGGTDAETGTLAHHLGELLLKERFEGADITADREAVVRDPLYSATMLEHVEDYVIFVEECMSEAKSRCPDPCIFIEHRIDLSEYVPEGFGTADCVIIADGIMDVIDYKNGINSVSAEDNPQMKLYALGCLLALGWAYQIDEIRMSIFQPKLGSATSATITTFNLLDWAECELKPLAAKAWEGSGEFCPGEHQCKWCKAGSVCRARAEYQLELARYDFKDPPLLEPAEIADIFLKKKNFESWLTQVKDYAEDQAINRGERFPGLKVVEGRSNRKYADENSIIKALKADGYKTADIHKPKELLGITAMEKLVGKKHFNEIAGDYIEKPPGAPTLVAESDKRPELNTAAKAAEDFADED